MPFARKAFSVVMLALLLTGTLASAFNIRPIMAIGPIYIRADGSIYPPTAPISTVDNVTYTLTGNIASDANVGVGITTERNNIVIDGDGYTIQGSNPDPPASIGIGLVGRTNVTIQNTQVKNFYYGIVLMNSSNNSVSGNIVANNSYGIYFWPYHSDYNSVIGNNITANEQAGIMLCSSSNSIVSGNNITANGLYGIYLDSSSNNSVSGNNITANNFTGICLYSSSNNNSLSGNNIASNSVYGILLSSSSNNSISGNNVTDSSYGIALGDSSSNIIYHNNFVNNTKQVYIPQDSASIWDIGYPSGGNYWSDYTGIDAYSGPDQNQPGSDGIWDTPYIIDPDNRDRYPLMNQFGTPGEEIDFVVLVTTMGNITIELFEDMPITTGNFKNLTQSGIYDGTLFDRVILGWLIQGGDASAKGIEVPPILDELPNKHSNVKGYVAMAKTSEPNSARDQFYINLNNNSDLDSHYSVFGRVVAGLDVVDSISEVPTDESDYPLQNVTILKAQLVTRAPPKFGIGDWVQTTANLNVREAPGLNYTIIGTMPLGTIGQILSGPVEADGFVWWDVDYAVGVRGWSAENWLELHVSEAPSCVVELQKDGVEIAEVGVWEFFDIYTGDSTSDIGIKQVRFSSDNVQDGYPTGEWTEWFDWSFSSEDWDATTQIKRWAFATQGYKEVWAEAVDEIGQTAVDLAKIFVPAPALPVLTSQLSIVPVKDIYNVGDSLEAEFIVKNIGDVPITLDVLTVGGRLNGFIPPEGAPDFTFQSVTLQPNEPYRYQGSLTLNRRGNYDFFVAYQIENPTPNEKKLLDENDWNTCVELGEGLAHTDRVRNIIVVEEGTAPEEYNRLGESIDREKNHHLQYQYPPYLLDANSFEGKLSKVWMSFKSFFSTTDLVKQYRQLYNAGRGYQQLAFKASTDAEQSFGGGNLEDARAFLNQAYRYDILSAKSFAAAAELVDRNLELLETLVRYVAKGCELFVRYSIKIVYPAAAPLADAFYLAVNFGITTKLEGTTQAAKDALIDVVLQLIFFDRKFISLGDNTLLEYVDRASEFVPLDTILANGEFMQEFGIYLREVLNERVANAILEGLVERITSWLVSLVESVRAGKKSPVDIRVFDSRGRVTGLINGVVKHEIPMSLYYNGTVTIFFPSDTYRFEVVGTDEGTYGLEMTYFKEGNITSFTAFGIPTSYSAIHDYTVDWDTISQGAKSTTVYVDSDGDGACEHTFFSDAVLTGDEFTMAMGGPVVESCNSTGTVKDSFDLSDSVYVKGEGYSTPVTYDLYVVNATTWSEGMPIPQRIEGTATTIASDTSGNISVTPAWNAPITLGNYDIVVDVNRDGYYNSSIDALDQSNVQIKAGFQTVPEFSQVTILVALMIITVSAIVLARKKRCRDQYVQYSSKRGMSSSASGTRRSL